MSFIPGANVGPYRIVEQAERSSVATTYTAYQPSQGRYVAVVVVPTIDHDDLTLLRQYQRQIELILGLRHPNILTVVDHGEHLGVPFVVTELIEAEPLGDRLGAPWPLAEVVRVLRPIAAALDYAHGQGVVHGDVRPSTVLLMTDGTPILAGFGQMTRRIAAPAGVSNGEPGRRTPSISEEIARAQQADRRGLALVAYEMLTGRVMEVETADLDRPLPPAQLGSPLLTAPVERVLLRELTGGPTDRHPEAASFVADLRAAAAPASQNGVAPTPPAPPRPAAQAGGESRRRLLTVGLIFAALAIFGTIVVLLRGGDAGRPIPAPTRAATDGAAESVGTSVTKAGTPATGADAAGQAAPTGAATASRPAAGAAVGTAAAGSPSRSGPTISLVVPTPEVTAGGLPGSAAAPAPAPTASGAAPQPAGTVVTAPSVLPPTFTPAPRPTTAPAAAGSTRLPVTWRVVGDPSGRWMLDDAGRVAGRTETGASMVLFPETVDDVDFSALVSTTSCQATLVFRAQDDDNLLMAIYIPDGLPNPGTTGGGVWLYQRVEGLDLPIRAVRPSTVRPAGEAVRLRILTSGPQIAIFLDDQPAMQAMDTAPRPGRLGLMVYSTSGRLCEATFGDIQR